MKKISVGLLATLAAVLIAGCANQKDPAQQAIAAADSALAAAHDTAQKYVPDQLQAVNDQLTQLKDAFAKGDYKSVLTGAPALTASIGSLKAAAEAKKADVEAALAQAKAAWGPLGTDLPKTVDSIQARVDAITKTHKMPKGLTKDGLAAAKTTLESLKSTWSEALAASASGDFTAAVSKAQSVKDKAGEVMKSLGMPGS